MSESMCCFCGSKMRSGHIESKYRVDDAILVITNIPAEVCNMCGNALLTPTATRKIEKTIADYRAGKLSVKPLTAAEVAFE